MRQEQRSQGALARDCQFLPPSISVFSFCSPPRENSHTSGRDKEGWVSGVELCFLPRHRDILKS